MFNSIKAQVSAYKWIIIISMIGLLAIGGVWQYHRASILEEQQATLKTENAQLKVNIDGVSKNLKEYKESTDKALADLAVFRAQLAEISANTAGLQKRVDGLKTSPAPGGTNAKQLEDEANALTKELFQRMQDSSKGKTKWNSV